MNSLLSNRSVLAAPRCLQHLPTRASKVMPSCVVAAQREATTVTAPQNAISASSASAFFWLLSAAPALAEGAVDFGSGGNADPKSYYTVLGLFLLSLPGLWSQIKRSPKAKIKRKTFTADGPKAETPVNMDDRARQLFGYMKNYNYEVKETGEVIKFSGNYRSSRGQAAAITFYTFIGMLCTGLVLSLAAPGGDKWYGLVALTPLSTWYYYKNGNRAEEFSIKMVLSDDESEVDIMVQGDDEEIERMRKEFSFMEKDMVYVPGVFEKVAEKK